MSKPTVGWIGLGAMGSGMAKSLVEQGFPVQVYDVWAPSVESAVAAGATAAPTPADAARGAKILGLMVVNAVQVEDVLFGAGQVANVLEKGSSIICFSTVPPSFLATVAARLAALGIGLCDSPVSGGSTRAAAGSLAVMTSGTSESIQAASPVLEALTRQPGGHSIVGDTCGDASSFKLINQVFCAVQIAMASESMAFGAKLGLNPRLLQNTCSQLAGSSFMLGHRMPWQLRHDGVPKSAMTIIYKDSGIVNEEARLLAFPAPMSSAAEQLFTAAIGSGMSREDDGLLVKLYERFGGVVVAEQGSEEDSIAAAQELKITPAQVGQVSVVGEGKLGEFVSAQLKSGNVGGAQGQGGDVVVIAVDNLLQAEAALANLSGLQAGTTIVLISNAGPTAIAGIQSRLQSLGQDLQLVDAAVSYKDGPIVIASGEEAALSSAAPALQAISPVVHYLPGGVGTAAKVKTVDTLLAAVHLATAAEAVNFARHKGMDLTAVMQIINSGAAASYMAASRVDRMRSASAVEPQHTVEQMLADLAIVLAESRKAGLPLFLGATAYSQFLAAQAQGLKGEDDSTVGRLWEHLGIKVRGV